METKAGKARPTLSSCSSPEAVVVGKGLGEGGCQSEPPLSLPAKVRSVLPAPQGVEGVQHRGLGQPLALVWSEGASGLQGAAGWAGRGGGAWRVSHGDEDKEASGGNCVETRLAVCVQEWA